MQRSYSEIEHVGHFILSADNHYIKYITEKTVLLRKSETYHHESNKE